MPKRKLNKVEDCLLTNGIAIDAIKCLNWKYMDTHPGKCSQNLCAVKTYVCNVCIVVDIILLRPRMQGPVFEINFRIWKYGHGSTEM